MRFQIVRTRPGFGVEERLQIYSEKHNADLWLADQGGVTNSEGSTVVVAADDGVVWEYRVAEIEVAAEPAEMPEAAPLSSRGRRSAKASTTTTKRASHATKSSKATKPARKATKPARKATKPARKATTRASKATKPARKTTKATKRPKKSTS